ncbi:hypothetical protein Goshw_015772 [Gossypium schwendimanii]|uniref:phosphogluconate dehydrogenase (NADP(+)-dependent, decarboxylating) n=1 Tax=Gossypium schwendimanii TaxID=34291 RepID=A0A7J9MP73_GOSSC|nr:hypothetical protein [Gossypium schwendimanii]
MGVSGGEEGAWRGPLLMPGGSYKAYKYKEDILLKVATQVTHRDLALLTSAKEDPPGSSLMKNYARFSPSGIMGNLGFLIEITADIFGIKDDKGEGYLVDKVLDKTGMKSTGKWTVQKLPRFLGGLKDEGIEAAKVFTSWGLGGVMADVAIDKNKLVDDVRQALIKKSRDLKLGELAWIWKGGCIIHAVFSDRIKKAYDRNPNLANLLVDPEFAKGIMEQQSAWGKLVSFSVNSGISMPGMSSSLACFDSYPGERLLDNLVQAQKDYF